MHPEYDVYMGKIPIDNPEDMEQFQQRVDKIAESLNLHITHVAKKLGVSHTTASNIVYLRGRSRWTQELEDRIVNASKAGHEINLPVGDEEEELAALGF